MRYFYSLLCLILITSSSFAANKTGKAKCLRTGGEWGTWSVYQASQKMETRRYVAKDAGKSCTDGKECSVARCEYDPETKTAQCAKYEGGYGCHIWMKDGKPQPKLCKD